MTDPPRLLDHGADDFERALLRSVQRDAGSQAAELRCVAALSGAAVFATPAAASATLLGVGLKSAAIGIGLGLLAGGGMVLTGAIEQHSSVAVVASAAPRQQQKERPGVVPERAAAPPIEPIQPPSPSRPMTREPSARTPPIAASPLPSAFAVPVESAAPDRELEREVRLLDSVRHALAHGDARAAEQQLDRHAREFTHGTLQPEALVLRVQTLLAEHRQAEAELIARRFLAANPTGAHAEHLRQLFAASR